MNKNLIQQLLDQSCYDEQDQRELEDWCNVEKFAELIIRECTDVGTQWADGLIDTNHYAFVNKKIKQHFGVEE